MTYISQHRSEYCALINAIHRCHNTSHEAYYNYGGRGIEVCPEWRGEGGFCAFLNHIRPKPDPALTLDRIDNDKGYEPGNVRWATRSEQQNNRRGGPATRYLQAVRIARETGINLRTILGRMKNGWADDELALPIFTHSRASRCADRNRIMRERYQRGETIEAIAAAYGLGVRYTNDLIRCWRK